MVKSRKIILVNPKFQLRFSFYVCSWIFALSLVYPIIISNLFDFLVVFSERNSFGAATETLKEIRTDFIGLVVLLQVAFMGITFLISLFLSHKIAGPLYKLTQHFNEVASGNLSTRVTFRKNDHFKEVAAGFNAMLDSVESKIGTGKKEQ